MTSLLKKPSNYCINFASKIFNQLNLSYFINNPMLLFITILCSAASLITLHALIYNHFKARLYMQISFWLWTTIIFSVGANRYAESKVRARSRVKPVDSEAVLFKKINDIKNLDKYEIIEDSLVQNGDLILIENGNILLNDAVIVQGHCSIDESDLVGSLNDRVMSKEEGDEIIAGSIIETIEPIIVKIILSKKKSLYKRFKNTVKKIRRQSLPSEIALQRIILGISILFITVIYTIWSIARYSGFNIPLIYLISLTIVLLPTTISGLQYAIITYGKAKLLQNNIIINDQNVIESIVDLNIVLIDKTGTITHGQRAMTSCHNFSDLNQNDFMHLLHLSSFQDTTYEGQNITKYANNHCTKGEFEVEHAKYHNIAFTSEEPISGCNYRGLEIRKGSLGAISKYLGITTNELPRDILEEVTKISQALSTPLILTVDKVIIGVLALRDCLRRGAIKQIQKLHEQKLQVILITGDNELVAKAVADKLNIKQFYANALPMRKLEIIKDLQSKGYVTAMCGDGINDSLALAQADVGIVFADDKVSTEINSNSIQCPDYNLANIAILRNICKKISARRGLLTVFSLVSDISKYFVVVPSLFITSFPALSSLNLLKFHSIDSVILSSVMFNALIIPLITPIIFRDFLKVRSKFFAWRSLLFSAFSGIITPIFTIKLIELFILKIGLV